MSWYLVRVSGCSRKAIVTAQSTQTDRLSSVIVAEEVGGGIVLRCDVFVDTISRIEITTRTRELLLEEEPERFELQAFDEEGEWSQLQLTCTPTLKSRHLV